MTMWVVRVGDELYVRSAYGPENGWYRRARASGTGRIRAAGSDWGIDFADAAADVHDDIDAACHEKYDRHGPRIVGTVVGAHTHPVTIRLVRRDDPA